jgi:two-component system response regulator BaeR
MGGPMSLTRSEILIVEDEPKIAELLREYLDSQGGFNAYIIDRGDQVMKRFRSSPPDLVLLDLMLPGLDGIEVCKQLRAESDVPIIMITARVEEIDRLLGLELGADDYICKPFSPREVVARVKAVLRRTLGNRKGRLDEGIHLDEEGFCASINGHALELTAVEFGLLKTLSRHPGRVYSRDQLMNEMYSDYRVVTDRAVDTHIKNLRKKLARGAPGQEIITSVYGVGYRMEIAARTAGNPGRRP